MSAWIEINLDCIKSNYRTVCSMTDSTVTCVVKSNAYGHGSVRICQALQEEGCNSFAVSSIREGLELRASGIQGEILVMGLTDKHDDIPEAISHHLSLTAGDIKSLKDFELAAHEINRPVDVFLKIDTGMHRIGFECSKSIAEEIAECISRMSFMNIKGIYSHLGLINAERDHVQCKNLIQMREWLSSMGVQVNEMHLCDSIGFVRYPEWHFDRIRVGAFLYGVRPAHTENLDFTCLEALQLKASIVRIHVAEQGEYIGYSDEMPVMKTTRIATISAGYGDGYPRSLSNGKGVTFIRGKRAPVIGIICMDQMMVDVTDIPEASEGDEAILLGGPLTYNEAADRAGTNRNELITILSRRPVRYYYEKGKMVTRLDELKHQREDYR